MPPAQKPIGANLPFKICPVTHIEQPSHTFGIFPSMTFSRWGSLGVSYIAVFFWKEKMMIGLVLVFGEWWVVQIDKGAHLPQLWNAFLAGFSHVFNEWQVLCIWLLRRSTWQGENEGQQKLCEVTKEVGYKTSHMGDRHGWLHFCSFIFTTEILQNLPSTIFLTCKYYLFMGLVRISISIHWIRKKSWPRDSGGFTLNSERWL